MNKEQIENGIKTPPAKGNRKAIERKNIVGRRVHELKSCKIVLKDITTKCINKQLRVKLTKLDHNSAIVLNLRNQKHINALYCDFKK